MVVFAALTLVGLYEAGLPAWLAVIITLGGHVCIGVDDSTRGFATAN